MVIITSDEERARSRELLSTVICDFKTAQNLGIYFFFDVAYRTYNFSSLARYFFVSS